HEDVEANLAWIDKIAESAAAMTQTSLVDRRLDTDCHELVPNRPIADALDRNLRLVGAPKFDESEKAFAAKIRATIADAPKGAELNEEVLPLQTEPRRGGGSTDVGDVSWLAPTEQFVATTQAHGCPGHSWQ